MTPKPIPRRNPHGGFVCFRRMAFQGSRDLWRFNQRFRNCIAEPLFPVALAFDAPTEGRVAVKVIDRAAMETMRILEVSGIRRGT